MVVEGHPQPHHLLSCSPVRRGNCSWRRSGLVDTAEAQLHHSLQADEGEGGGGARLQQAEDTAAVGGELLPGHAVQVRQPRPRLHLHHLK